MYLWASRTFAAALIVAMLVVVVVDACPYTMGGGMERHDVIPAHHPPVGQFSTGTTRNLVTEPSARHGRKLQNNSNIFVAFFDFIWDLIAAFLDLFTGGNNNDIIVTDLTTAIAAARRDIQALLTDDRAAEFLRLSFHDCTGDGVAMCDGCLDMSNIDNRGLQDPIDDLQPVVEDYADFLTRGDIWALAAYVAVEEQQPGNVVSFDLEFVGRPSCDDPSNPPPDDLPSAHLTTSGLTGYFASKFGFSDRETTAIMGAHTLGTAVAQNSGFDGNNGWVQREEDFDNQFYGVLLGNNGQVDTDFVLEEQDNDGLPFPNQFLWRDGGRFMLNADMALVVDFAGAIDATTGHVTCVLEGNDAVCPTSRLAPIAQSFAANDNEWRTAFHDAFLKLTNRGCGGAGTTTTCTAIA